MVILGLTVVAMGIFIWHILFLLYYQSNNHYMSSLISKKIPSTYVLSWFPYLATLELLQCFSTLLTQLET
jgi:hypothetical protein